jgi:hypothetical protein
MTAKQLWALELGFQCYDAKGVKEARIWFFLFHARHFRFFVLIFSLHSHLALLAQSEMLVSYIPLLTIVVIGPRKPNTKTEVSARLELNDVY